MAKAKAKNLKVFAFPAEAFSQFINPKSPGSLIISAFYTPVSSLSILPADNNPRPGFVPSPNVRREVLATVSETPDSAPLAAMNRGLLAQAESVEYRAKDRTVLITFDLSEIKCGFQGLCDGNTTQTTIAQALAKGVVNPDQYIRIEVLTGASALIAERTALARNNSLAVNALTVRTYTGVHDSLRSLLVLCPDNVVFSQGDEASHRKNHVDAGNVVQLLCLAHPLLVRGGDMNKAKSLYVGMSPAYKLLEGQASKFDMYEPEIVQEILGLYDSVHAILGPKPRQVKSAGDNGSIWKGSYSPLFSRNEIVGHRLGKGFAFPLFFALTSALTVVDGKVVWNIPLEDVLNLCKRKRDSLVNYFQKYDNDTFGKDVAQWNMVHSLVWGTASASNSLVAV